MTMLSDGMLLGVGVAALPTIASFSQSSVYVGTGVEAASVANMSDGLFQPFAATTNSGDNQYIRATLTTPGYVPAVLIGPPTSAGSWSASQLNGAVLEITDDNGSGWTTVRTLSGYVTATSPTVGTMVRETIGAVCTDIRVRRPGSGYVVLSEFKIVT